MKTTRQIANEQQQNPTKWDATSLPSVKEVVKEVANIQPKNVYTPDWQSMLTRDRNQAYTRLVEGIEGRMEEHDGGAYSTQLEKQVHDREVFLYNQALTDILEKVVKPLYNKTGDN